MDDINQAEIIAEIGGMILQETSNDLENVFLYVEAEDGVVATSLFKDVGVYVDYINCSSNLAMRILDLWDAADKNKKWAALFLTIQGDQFNALFQYPEEWGDEDEFERRARVLSAKYGDKEIRYPPLEDVNR